VPDLLVLVAEYCASDGHEFVEQVATAGLTPLLDSDPDRLGVVLVAEVSEEAGALLGYVRARPRTGHRFGIVTSRRGDMSPARSETDLSRNRSAE
jgi:hypothetical protein